MPNNAPTGEPETEYERSKDLGQFSCSNCEHFSAGVCEHPIMIAVSKQPRRKGKPVVDPEGCCKFVRRKGEK